MGAIIFLLLIAGVKGQSSVFLDLRFVSGWVVSSFVAKGRARHSVS